MHMRAFLPLLLLSCNVSYAGLFDDSQAREQIEALRTQVTEMEARMKRTEEALMGQALIELHTQMEALKAELSKLRGQIEVLQDENQSLRKQQKDFYLDLDNRLRQMEPDSPDMPALDSKIPASPTDQPTATVTDTPSKKTTVALQLPDAVQRDSYDKAYTAFKEGDYTGAITGFENFLAQHPLSALAPAAAYWIGNAHYALRNFDEAIAAQQRLIEAYPDSSKAPDGLLNMASSQIEIGQKPAARKTLEKLITSYPSSDAAEKAKRRLGALR
jgi:tol-pal system protein YbgF